MFRFTIRDVLWLMVVVGMGLAWVADHSRLNGLKKEATKWHKAGLSIAERVKWADVKISFHGEPVHQVYIVFPNGEQSLTQLPRD